MDKSEQTTRPPIAPSTCEHRRRLHICGGQVAGENFSYHYGVTVCRDCGTFHVHKQENGETITVEFAIGSADALKAASQYLKWINEDDSPVQEVDPNLLFLHRVCREIFQYLNVCMPNYPEELKRKLQTALSETVYLESKSKED